MLELLSYEALPKLKDECIVYDFHGFIFFMNHFAYAFLVLKSLSAISIMLSRKFLFSSDSEEISSRRRMVFLSTSIFVLPIK